MRLKREAVWQALRATGGDTVLAAQQLNVPITTYRWHLADARRQGTFPADIKIIKHPSPRKSDWGWGSRRQKRQTEAPARLDTVLVLADAHLKQMGLKRDLAVAVCTQRRLAGLTAIVHQPGGKVLVLLCPANANLTADPVDLQELVCLTLSDWACHHDIPVRAVKWLVEQGRVRVYGRVTQFIAVSHPLPTPREIERATRCSTFWKGAECVRFFLSRGKSVAFIQQFTGLSYESVHQLASRARRLGQLPPAQQRVS